MGLPFSKIIQNNEEYDVSPYTHKIEVTADKAVASYNMLIQLFTALSSEISDFNTIKYAKLIMTHPHNGSDYHNVLDLILTQTNTLVFASVDVLSTQSRFTNYEISSTPHVYQCIIDENGTYFRDRISGIVDENAKWTLYYT